MALNRQLGNKVAWRHPAVSGNALAGGRRSADLNRERTPAASALPLTWRFIAATVAAISSWEVKDRDYCNHNPRIAKYGKEC
jgi:hypothetical protein